MAVSQSPKFPANLSRRNCLRYAFYASTATAAAPLLSACGSSSSSSSPSTPISPGDLTGAELNIPLGPLSEISGLSLDPATQIQVPDGFGVRAIATSGAPVMTPGGAGLSTFPFVWHNLPDGGATYSTEDGGWVYTSNAEVPGGSGGCSAVKFNASGEVVDAYSILTGTSTNCAGGKTPWQTWVSCEETGDGICWECDPFGPGEGVPKPSLGKFAHEAIAVDMENRTIYLTEDAGGGRFYRWIGDANDLLPGGERLAMEAGTLQVLNIDGYEDGGYPETVDEVRTLKTASWVDVVRPEDPQGTVRSELEADSQIVPGTNFKGGEGIWFYELPVAQRSTPAGGSKPTKGLVFFTTKGDNRVWAFDIENQLIELIFDNEQIEPDFGDVDNLTVSPWGDIVVAEDPPTSPNSRIMIVLPSAESKVLVQCEHPGSEICGPAFSPDGSRLYFSSQRRNGSGETYELLIPESFRRG